MEKPDFFKIKYIEQYLNVELEADEMKEFELEISNNPVLKEKVEQIKKMPDHLFTIEKDRLAQNVKNWMDVENSDAQNSSKKQGFLIPFYMKVLGIAGIVIIILTAIWLIPSSSTLDQKSQQYIAQVYHNPVVLRGSANESWELAIENYANRDFDQMINQMDKWIDNKNATAEQLFYFGLAHLYNSKPSYEIALDYFSKTDQKDPSTYNEDIAWHKALIFITQKEYEKARSELMKIRSTNRYGQNAEDLLKKMK